MKILYGIQGTGNGHLSRGRAMAKHFANSSAEVTYLFSGRPREKFFDMAPFGDFKLVKGFTFYVDSGCVSYTRTAMSNNPLKFAKEVYGLSVEDYDVIITDFEPVSAWAGKLKGKQVISFGHQPAFRYDIPIEGEDWLAKQVMNWFAPANIHIGLHWHHFGADILPPIIHIDEQENCQVENNKVLVYLPFENHSDLPDIFKLFSDFEFYIYHPDHKEHKDDKNIHIRPQSLEGFQYDLHSANSVICSAGFELPSECIYLGKRLLVKPVVKQMEQLSNAVALEQLGLGKRITDLKSETLKIWLEESPQDTSAIKYPDVARALVDWVISGNWSSSGNLKQSLWDTMNALPSAG